MEDITKKSNILNYTSDQMKISFRINFFFINDSINDSIYIIHIVKLKVPSHNAQLLKHSENRALHRFHPLYIKE